MTANEIDAAASLLRGARASGQWLNALPDHLAPRDEAAAYAIQDAVLSGIGPAGGWKVGARGPEAPPNCAPLPRALVFDQGVALPAGLLRLRGVEAEIGFKLGEDLPPRAAPYTVADVTACIASVHTTIEVVESRYADFRAVEALSVLADSNSNGALIVGQAISAQSAAGYGQLEVVLKFDGAEQLRVRGGNPALDLLRLLAWLANHCAERCGGLKRGDIVTTGSHTGMRFAEPGTKVEAAFTGLGGLSVLL